MIAFVDGKKYSTLDFETWEEAKENPAAYSSNWAMLEWNILNNVYSITFQKGTLLRDIVSEDGKYLILIYRGNSDFPEPCNAVVYNLEGKVHKVVCAPYEPSDRLLGSYEKVSEIESCFYGASFQNTTDGSKKLTISFTYPNISMVPGAGSYMETRFFDPETGEMGQVFSSELPFR